jgi:hypothetical protein
VCSSDLNVPASVNAVKDDGVIRPQVSKPITPTMQQSLKNSESQSQPVAPGQVVFFDNK